MRRCREFVAVVLVALKNTAVACVEVVELPVLVPGLGHDPST